MKIDEVSTSGRACDRLVNLGRGAESGELTVRLNCETEL